MKQCPRGVRSARLLRRLSEIDLSSDLDTLADGPGHGALPHVKAHHPGDLRTDLLIDPLYLDPVPDVDAPYEQDGVLSLINDPGSLGG